MTNSETTERDRKNEQYFMSGYEAGKQDAADPSLKQHPNPVRTLESHGVTDQTEWAACRTNPEHRMESLKTNSEKVPFVEQCVFCGWIDGASLTWWADNAIKDSITNRAKRIAVSVETDPFAFVQSPEQELTRDEILGQAMGAVSMCWDPRPHSQVFDSTRATEILNATIRELDRFRRLALEAAATRAAEFVRNRSGVVPEKELPEFHKAIEDAS